MKILNLLKEMLPETDPITVIDVGARGATTAAIWRAFAPKLRFLGFEPDHKECEILNNKIKDRNLSWEEKYYPIALARENSTRVMHITERPECSSFLMPNRSVLEGFAIADYLSVKKTLPLEAMDLTSWTRCNSVYSVDFIKLDVQGAELEVLEGGVETLDLVMAIEVEVEFIEVYKNQPLFPQVDMWIRPKGFILFDICPVYKKRCTVLENSPSLGQLVWGDALYLRDINTLPVNKLNGEELVTKILKLAAIADLYNRPDYSLYVLEKAIEKYSNELGNSMEKLQIASDKCRSLCNCVEQRENKRQSPLMSAMRLFYHDRAWNSVRWVLRKLKHLFSA